jgi:sterol desaturase/sphingolipid hydroxylase (fatty acid hydroxylase superfamily)
MPNLRAALLSIVFLVLLFVPLEKNFPAKKGQKIFRKKWLLDLSFYFGQYLLWNSLVVYVFYEYIYNLKSIIPIEFHHFINDLPFYLELILLLLLSDFFIYWAHRLQHNIPFLWRFHKVHHSAECMDWLASYREHPFDSIYTVSIINLPILILGFPLESIAGIIAFRGIWAIYIHANVRLSIGKLRVLIGAPELHHWHHDLDKNRGNYANILPVMDLLFGTYYCPDIEPEKFGIKEKSPKTYFGQLIEPLFSKWYWKTIKNSKDLKK